MEVDELLQRIIRRHGVMLFLFVLIAAALAAVVRVSLPVEYASSARVVLRPEPPQSAVEAQTAADEAAALVTSDSFVSQALTEAKEPSGIDEQKLVHVSVSALGTSGIAEITATYNDRAAVRIIADSLASQYIALQTSVARQNVASALKQLDDQDALLAAQIGQIESRLRATPAGPVADYLRDQHMALMTQRTNLADRRNQVASDAELSKIPVLVDHASVGEQVSSHLPQDAALAGLIGLVVGLLIAALREILSPSLVGRRAVSKALGVPLLGYLPGPPWATSALESKEARDIAAAALLLTDSQKVDGLELLGVGPDPDVDKLARRLSALIGDLQPAAPPDGQAYSPFLAVLGQPRSTRRVSVRVFADERRQVKPNPVVVVVPTSIPASQLDQAKDLARIAGRRVVGAISFRKTERGNAVASSRQQVRAISGKSAPIHTRAGEA